MTGRRIGIGLIGFGFIGEPHARIIANHPECALLAISDTNPELLRRAYAAFPDAAICESSEALFDTPGVSAVVIATPNVTHAELSIAAARRGMHVLCEKPLAMNPREAWAMVDAARKNRVVGMTNFTYRWVRSFRLARDLVRKGEFGPISRVHVKYLQSYLMDPNAPIAWRSLKHLSGFGTLGDLGSHMIDSVCFITGARPRRVVGVHNIHTPFKMDPKTGRKVKVTADTDAQFMVDFGSFVGTFEASQVEPAHGNRLIVSFGAEKGTCQVSNEDGDNIEVALGEPYATHQTWVTSIPKVAVPTSFTVSEGCIADFVSAIRHRLKDYPSFESGAIVQDVLAAIARSAQSGRWEKL